MNRIYRHYKNRRLYGIVERDVLWAGHGPRSHGANARLVVYRDVLTNGLYVRPDVEFFAIVDFEGEFVPRFILEVCE